MRSLLQYYIQVYFVILVFIYSWIPCFFFNKFDHYVIEVALLYMFFFRCACIWQDGFGFCEVCQGFQPKSNMVSHKLHEIVFFGESSNVLSENNEIRISCKYAYLHKCVLINYKVLWNSVERFQRSRADKLFQ